MKLRSLLNENIESWSKSIKAKYNLKTFFVFEYDDTIQLSSIIINKENQGQGTGSKVMEELCKYADRNKMKIVLTPGLTDKQHGTTSQSRLIDFYKKFDFVLNKGRNKDFTISELMFRLPK